MLAEQAEQLEKAQQHADEAKTQAQRRHDETQIRFGGQDIKLLVAPAELDEEVKYRAQTRKQYEEIQLRFSHQDKKLDEEVKHRVLAELEVV